MKKISFFIAAVMLMCGSAQSQDVQLAPEPVKHTYLQVYGGVNFSKYFGNAYASNFNPGVYSGVAVGHKLNRLFFVEYGAAYIEKGYSTKLELPSANKLRVNEITNYLSLPVAAGIEIGDKVKFKFRQSLGLDYLVDAHISFVSEGEEYEKITTFYKDDGSGNLTTVPYKEAFHRFDFSLISSAGVKIPLGKYFIGSDLQFLIGTRPLRKHISAITPSRFWGLSGTINIGVRL